MNEIEKTLERLRIAESLIRAVEFADEKDTALQDGIIQAKEMLHVDEPRSVELDMLARQVRSEQAYKAELNRMKALTVIEKRIKKQADASAKHDRGPVNLCAGRHNARRPCAGRMVKKWSDLERGQPYKYVCDVCGRTLNVKQTK